MGPVTNWSKHWAFDKSATYLGVGDQIFLSTEVIVKVGIGKLGFNLRCYANNNTCCILYGTYY